MLLLMARMETTDGLLYKRDLLSDTDRLGSFVGEDRCLHQEPLIDLLPAFGMRAHANEACTEFYPVGLQQGFEVALLQRGA